MFYTKASPQSTSDYLQRFAFQSSLDFIGHYDEKILQTFPILQGKGLEGLIDVYCRKVHDFETKKDTNHVLLCWFNVVRNSEGMRENKPKFLQLEGADATKLIEFRNDIEKVKELQSQRLGVPPNLKHIEKLL